VDHKSGRLIVLDDQPNLLRRPARRWMRGQVPVQDSPCADPEHLDREERGRHDHEEIAGKHRVSVVPHEGDSKPPFRDAGAAVWTSSPPHCSRRESNPKLHEQLHGNPFFTHVRFAAAIVAMSWRRSLGAADCPAPSISSAKTDGTFFDANEMSVSGFTIVRRRPVDEPAQRDERDACGIVGTPGLQLFS
jgi:hypothetical protein